MGRHQGIDHQAPPRTEVPCGLRYVRGVFRYLSNNPPAHGHIGAVECMADHVGGMVGSKIRTSFRQRALSQVMRALLPTPSITSGPVLAYKGEPSLQVSVTSMRPPQWGHGPCHPLAGISLRRTETPLPHMGHGNFTVAALRRPESSLRVGVPPIMPRR